MRVPRGRWRESGAGSQKKNKVVYRIVPSPLLHLHSRGAIEEMFCGYNTCCVHKMNLAVLRWELEGEEDFIHRTVPPRAPGVLCGNHRPTPREFPFD